MNATFLPDWQAGTPRPVMAETADPHSACGHTAQVGDCGVEDCREGPTPLSEKHNGGALSAPFGSYFFEGSKNIRETLLLEPITQMSRWKVCTGFSLPEASTRVKRLSLIERCAGTLEAMPLTRSSVVARLWRLSR